MCVVARLHAGVVVASALLLSITAVASAQKPAPKNQSNAPSTPTTPDRIGDLEQQVKALQSRVIDLDRRVGYNFATLDCNSKKYVEFRLEDSLLVFFALCQNVEPYLEGHRVTLTIGNPYSFNFRNVKGRLQYGKTFAEALGQKVEISPTDVLRGGAWQPLIVIVNPSKAEDLRELWIELSAETAGSTR